MCEVCAAVANAVISRAVNLAVMTCLSNSWLAMTFFVVVCWRYVELGQQTTIQMQVSWVGWSTTCSDDLLEQKQEPVLPLPLLLVHNHQLTKCLLTIGVRMVMMMKALMMSHRVTDTDSRRQKSSSLTQSFPSSPPPSCCSWSTNISWANVSAANGDRVDDDWDGCDTKTNICCKNPMQDLRFWILPGSRLQLVHIHQLSKCVCSKWQSVGWHVDSDDYDDHGCFTDCCRSEM